MWNEIYSSQFVYFTNEPKWRARLDEVIDEHFCRPRKRFSKTNDEIKQSLGKEKTRSVLSWAFDDFVTRNYGLRSENVVDEYLSEQKALESAATVDNLLAIKSSVMSLYFFCGRTNPPQIVMDDVLRNSDSIFFNNVEIAKGYMYSHRIAARIVGKDERAFIIGSIMPFLCARSILTLSISDVSAELTTFLIQVIGDENKEYVIGERAAASLSVDQRSAGDYGHRRTLSDSSVRKLNPDLTGIWIIEQLSETEEEKTFWPLPSL